MKIGEAQQACRKQMKAYQTQRAELAGQLQVLRSRMKAVPDGQEQYKKEAATLELTLQALDEKQQEYQDYLSRLSEQYYAYWSAEAAKQQASVSEDRVADIGKIMEVARRLMKGAIVPAADEKKLMEFSMDMYQMAKNVGSMIRRQKREKYDSLWEEEEKKEYGDPGKAAENREALPPGPEMTLQDIMQTLE